MPLNVSYKNRIGYYTDTQEIDGKKYKYKMWFCHANALCAIMYFYNKEEDGKKVPMVQLHGFFADLNHAKRCIKDGYFSGCSNFHFKAKEMDKGLWAMVKYMAEQGIKVTIE